MITVLLRVGGTGVVGFAGRQTEATSLGVAHGFLETSLEHPDFDVLPFVPRAWLDDAFQRLAHCDLELALRQKIVPVSWIPTMTMHAVVTPEALRAADAAGLKVVARIRPQDYRSLVRKRLGPRILDKAVFGLSRRDPLLSARLRLSGAQVLALTLVVASMGVAAAFISLQAALANLCLIASFFFALVVSLRLYCLLPLDSSPQRRPVPQTDSLLPIYTVLVPLFRETAVLDQLLGALSALDYPQDLLDIKLILEEDDIAMQQAVACHALPPKFDVVIVPAGKPQTKPRALNYALAFARGSLVTIFDSEDLPRPQQLRLAAARFAEAPDDLACLQAALVFYNGQENWLTRHFAAEYAALFKVVLPALAERRMPLLLGGTSNHFRMSALEAAGGWDAFNVTEDADLGIRLARMGYVTDVIDSETFEEANPAFFNWMKQRRRWLKGFLQTWLVHMRSPATLLRELGFHGFVVVQCMTIGIFASALLHPILLAYSVWMLTPTNLKISLGSPVSALLAGSTVAFLLLGYGVAMAASVQGLARLRAPVRATTLLTLPVYWLMMSAAAWAALWDFVVRPFHWHKTQHGLSKLVARKPTAPAGGKRRKGIFRFPTSPR